MLKDSAVYYENIFHTTWICNDLRRLGMQVTDQFGHAEEMPIASSTVQIAYIFLFIIKWKCYYFFTIYIIHKINCIVLLEKNG